MPGYVQRSQLAYVICNLSSLEEITEIVSRCKRGFYQIVEPVTGALPFGDPRMNNAIWPGFSDLIIIKGSEDTILELRKHLDTYNLTCRGNDEKVVMESWTID